MLTPKEKGGGAAVKNYFGEGSDGDAIIAVDTNLASSLDGDMIVKNYSSLTINSGQTLTLSNRCRGMLIFVDGDCTIEGTLSMTARGCHANPADAGVTGDTPVAPSDGNAVPVDGITLRFLKEGETDSNSDADIGNGLGSVAQASFQNFPPISGDGLVFQLPRVGGSGGAANPSADGNAGGTLALAPGGGSSGQRYYAGTTGKGGDATCFSGGTGSGGGGSSPAGNDFGGAGSAGTNNGGGTAAAGGTGNPGGAGYGTGPQGFSGTGGVIILIVKGTLTIGAAGAIHSKGTNGAGNGVGGNSGAIPAGCSGGGNIFLAHAGTYTNNGDVSVAGGIGASGAPWGYPNPSAPGGAGSITVQQIAA